MWGFVAGAVSVAVLYKLSRRRWRGRGRWGWRQLGMRRLYRALETTPAQEGVIDEALNTVQQAASGVFETGRGLKIAMQQAMGAERFDTTTVTEAYVVAQTRLDELKTVSLEAMRKVHETLTAQQRQRLVELSSRPHGRCGGHSARHRAYA